MWKSDFRLDKYIMPILIDLRFRLQHNGLNTRRKYSYHTTDVNRSHGCDSRENAKYLLWDCDIAQSVWNELFKCLDGLLKTPITWQAVQLHFTDDSLQHSGHRNLVLGFHILRSAGLYLLWIHRNDKIYQHVSTSTTFVRCMATSYAKLHLKRVAKMTDNTRLRELMHTITDKLLENSTPS
ncbi:hypothetical protein PsorP6_008392 [Peronosclerospora sorghi]|uniref:Uncharacterized protein n=1 Tax=Peronosclerospora sorghi TaxID=230839 RepID=A0ACC0W736_9STRA|nr:hypothetical protein PsorP6_008392 [Peronosclerospora sorghi]